MTHRITKNQIGKPTVEEKQAEIMTNHTFTLKGGRWYTLTRAKFDEFKKTYPTHDLDKEFRKMIEWCRCNPRKRKTASGMCRFINSWLSKSNGYEKTKLYPIKGRICDKANCGMPAVYKNNWGHTCNIHMPERVKELFC